LNGQADSKAAEASVRQLIANGKSKVALDGAKGIHKAQGTAASEALLVDAYAARIRSLLGQSLAVEAKALIDLVRDRYPSARERLEELTASAAARAGTLDELVGPLNDPAITHERRSAIENAIQRHVRDLAALARCAALAPEDSLRKAACALERVFLAVTSGPVADDLLTLPEVSHRSPLAPWKLLVRAIAYFYRGDDESCRRYIGAIQPESAPARLVPAIQAMLGGKPGAPLTAAATALVSRAGGNPAALRSSLEALDHSFASENEGHILRAIRAALQECRQDSPGLVERLKQHISVRSMMGGLEKNDVTSAMGGAPVDDAYYYRLFARGLEETGDPEDLAVACGVWDDFRKHAVREGWFAPNGAEAATLYLHMASVLRKIPGKLLREIQRSARPQKKGAYEDLHFLFPERLYERACALDPHSEAFSQWMEWATWQSAWQGRRVGEAWHKICPRDMEPILYLMEAAEKSGSFHTALIYLGKAEQIDSIHPGVRKARWRLLGRSAMGHIQKKKLNLADEKLAAMAALPQAQQGDRRALLAAVRYLASAVRGEVAEAAECRTEIERLLESRCAAAILIATVAAASKRSALDKPGPVEKLGAADRAALPVAIARTGALVEEMQLKLQIPWGWMVEAAKQFPRSRGSLDTGQLGTLSAAALFAGHSELAYSASAVGLERGGPTEGRFLLLRARSLPEWQGERRAVCAAAAAEFARRERDVELLREAVGWLGGLGFEAFSITADEGDEVLQKEKAAPEFPTGTRKGPDYRDIPTSRVCQCPDCRRARGGAVEPDESFGFDDEDFPEGLEIPADLPPEIAAMLIEETRQAVRNGESLDEFLARVTGGPSGGKRKEGRRK